MMRKKASLYILGTASLIQAVLSMGSGCQWVVATPNLPFSKANVAILSDFMNGEEDTSEEECFDNNCNLS